MRVDYNHPATWWFTYADGIPRVTYGREWLALRGDRYIKRAAWLDGMLPQGPGLVVGCAFGFLMEAMADAGRTDVWGVDTSEWIHSHLHQQGRPDVTPRILLKDIGDPDTGAYLAGIMGTLPKWVVTEEVLSAYHDHEAERLVAHCGALASKVLHIVNVGSAMPFNTHTLEEWAAMHGGHVWCDTEGRTAA